MKAKLIRNQNNFIWSVCHSVDIESLTMLENKRETVADYLTAGDIGRFDGVSGKGIVPMKQLVAGVCL